MNDSREQQVQQQLSDPDFHPEPNDWLAPDSIRTDALYGDDWCGWEAGYLYSEEEMAKVKSYADIDNDLIASRAREHYADPVKRKAYAKAFLKFANEYVAHSDSQLPAQVNSLKDGIDSYNIFTRKGLDTVTDAFWAHQVRMEGLLRSSIIGSARKEKHTPDVHAWGLGDEIKAFAATYTEEAPIAKKIADLIYFESRAKGYISPIDVRLYEVDLKAIDALAQVAA
jgi:hypothetical protein